MTVSLEDKSKQTIKIFGTKIPRWQDCKKCGAKLACAFNQVAYSQPCDSCKNTPEYEEELHKTKGRSMDDIMRSRQVASVFEGNGRTYYVNHKGDVIKDEPYKPLPVGKKGWR